MKKSYALKDAIKVSGIVRSFCQMAIQVTMITILAINEVNTPLKIVVISLSGFEILFNIIFIASISE